MSNVNIKYLKDESGKLISPVVSTDSIYKGTLNLSNYFKPILLASKPNGTAGASTYTVTSLSSFNYFILNCCTYSKRILETLILPYDMFTSTNDSHIATYAGEPGTYTVSVYYTNNTSIKLGTTSVHDYACFYGVRTL